MPCAESKILYARISGRKFRLLRTCLKFCDILRHLAQSATRFQVTNNTSPRPLKYSSLGAISNNSRPGGRKLEVLRYYSYWNEKIINFWVNTQKCRLVKTAENYSNCKLEIDLVCWLIHLIQLHFKTRSMNMSKISLMSDYISILRKSAPAVLIWWVTTPRGSVITSVSLSPLHPL